VRPLPAAQRARQRWTQEPKVTPVEALSAMLARHGMPPVGRRAYDLCVFAVRNDTSSNRFDDALGVAYREVDDGPIVMAAWRCTTDPGRRALLSPRNPRGTFALRDDYRHRALWIAGFHKRDPNRPALVHNPQVKAVGFRDNDRDAILERLVEVDDGGGINCHDGADEARPEQAVDNHSEGCVVSFRRAIRRLRELLALQKARGMGGAVSLHLFRRDTNPEADRLLTAAGVAL
jgi:hypothetical protein